MTTERRRYDLSVDFDDAVKKLLDLLHDSDGTEEGKTKAFFFRGWRGEGLGASAILRTISKLLKSTGNDSDMRKHFGKIIHVDCSVWKNRRMMQRAIAKELNLHHLMPFFDKQDEEDDFRGVDDSSRAEIATIGRAINMSLRDERFLMIFHYGGNDDIDLVNCGIPIFGEGKVLCTNHGSFQIQKREQKLVSVSSNIDISMYFSPDVSRQVCRSLHEEAVELIAYTGMDEISPEAVVNCFLYTVFLTEQTRENSISVDYDWATHACNYWICDGILHGDRAWEVANGLYGEITRLDYFSYGIRVLVSWLDRQIQPYKGWNSITSNKQGAQDISTVPVNGSSYFLTFEGDWKLLLRNDLFQQASNLRVLKLCNCSFDFSSPPFNCCHNLRFLCLDHCTDTGKEQDGVPCFPNLLVLDIRYTDCYVLLPQMIELMNNLRELNTKGVSWRTISHEWKKLQNLHKLRVTESSDVITVDSCSSIDMTNLELLDMSSNTCMESLPKMSSARSLKVLVLDNCSSLEHIAPGEAPELLESFSFDGYGQAENWTHFIQLPKKELRLKSRSAPVEAKVTKISLEGCARLHSVFLRGLPNLEELDLSGTAIKTLDLGAMDVPHLKKLFLIGCKQLRRLFWDETPKLDVLHVDTRGNMRSVVCCGEQGRNNTFEACISFIDGRLLGAFICGIYAQTYTKSKVHLHASSAIHNQVSIAKSMEEIDPSQEDLVPMALLIPYNDIVLLKDVTCSPLVWDRQQLHLLNLHVEIGKGSHNIESMHDENYSRRFCSNYVNSLHVHDNSSITTISTSTRWRALEWCHIEKCPKLHTPFTCQTGEGNFDNLRIVSASNLLMAGCIWGKGINHQIVNISTSFNSLQHIYLQNCPRLVFVLPISFTLPNLETLQISYCHNLRHVFPLDDKYPAKIASGVTFYNLKSIKLYHLHKLENICQASLLTAPALDTIILRDCWGLRRLPVVSRQGPKPVVDCEKNLWDKLKWNGLEADHDPSLFETHHSAYYKKTIPRGSLLRQSGVLLWHMFLYDAREVGLHEAPIDLLLS